MFFSEILIVIKIRRQTIWPLIEATYSSETVDFHQTTRCYIPEDITLREMFCFVTVFNLVGYYSLDTPPVFTNLVQEKERLSFLFMGWIQLLTLAPLP
jgi:hypothetical protein